MREHRGTPADQSRPVKIRRVPSAAALVFLSVLVTQVESGSKKVHGLAAGCLGGRAGATGAGSRQSPTNLILCPPSTPCTAWPLGQPALSQHGLAMADPGALGRTLGRAGASARALCMATPSGGDEWDILKWGPSPEKMLFARNFPDVEPDPEEVAARARAPAAQTRPGRGSHPGGWCVQDKTRLGETLAHLAALVAPSSLPPPRLALHSGPKASGPRARSSRAPRCARRPTTRPCAGPRRGHADAGGRPHRGVHGGGRHVGGPRDGLPPPTLMG